MGPETVSLSSEASPFDSGDDNSNADRAPPPVASKRVRLTHDHGECNKLATYAGLYALRPELNWLSACPYLPNTWSSAARTLSSWVLPSLQSVMFAGSSSWSPWYAGVPVHWFVTTTRRT
jgi:hypothetical protein